MAKPVRKYYTSPQSLTFLAGIALPAGLPALLCKALAGGLLNGYWVLIRLRPAEPDFGGISALTKRINNIPRA